MLVRLLLQLIGLVSISSLFGFWFVSFNTQFIIGFLIGVIIQITGFYFYSNIVDFLIVFKSKKLEVERLKQLSYQSVEVECPCYKKVRSFVPYRFNADNFYKCGECSKTISVFTTTETAVMTEPVIYTDIQPVLEQGLKNANTR